MVSFLNDGVYGNSRTQDAPRTWTSKGIISAAWLRCTCDSPPAKQDVRANAGYGCVVIESVTHALIENVGKSQSCMVSQFSITDYLQTHPYIVVSWQCSWLL
eukprot:COSAG05_NODE_5172_length_1245_cov_1.385689_1_plen_102_part_00